MANHLARRSRVDMAGTRPPEDEPKGIGPQANARDRVFRPGNTTDLDSGPHIRSLTKPSTAPGNCGRFHLEA